MLQVGLLRESFEQVKPQADAFVDAFYANLFFMYPTAKPLFEHTNMGKQKKMLLDSLVLTVENLTNPDILTEKLQGLGARHVKYGALPEHYPLVGNALLTTFEQFLGKDWTEEVQQAWVEAYGAITELMLSGAHYTAEEVALESASPAIEEEEGLKIGLLQSSFEKVKPQADAFVDAFYTNLFFMYPTAKPLFEHTNMGKQKVMLLESLVLTVDNLTNPEILTEKLQGLGARHVKYGALPEHYPLVGNALLTTFEQFLGKDWTDEVEQAWVEAYGAITELMLSGADYTAEEVALESAPTATVEEKNEEEGLKVALLQSSFEKVKPQADAFVDGFYHNLFTMYPAAKPLFEHTNMGKQKVMLLESLVLTVDNLTNPEILTEKLEGLGARHVKYGALPEHYPLVGNALLTTFEEFLGKDWTAEVKQAWVEAYGAITELMLSGADYTAEEIALDSATTPTEENSIPTNVETDSVESDLNWTVFGSVFAFGGVGIVALLLLL